MKKLIGICATIIIVIIGFFSIMAWGDSTTPNKKNSLNHSTIQERDSKLNEENSNNHIVPPSESEETENEKDLNGTLSEGLREVFTSVIESARGLFLRDDLNIVAIGDSLTQGVGDRTDNGGYVGILEKTFASNQENSQTLNITNYGKRGNRTDHLLKRMKQEEIVSSLEKANLVLITIGANDVMNIVKNNFTSLNYEAFVSAQEDYETQLNQILQQIHDLNPDAHVYLLGLYNPFNRYFSNIPELGQITSDWNRISKDVLSRYEQASLIPIKDIFNGSEENLLWEEDYFHPNEKGYKRIAERVLEYIRPQIEQ